MKIYIVHTPAWESEFDSAWTTEEQAQDRADELDPHPDKDGVRWGIVTEYELDGDPDQEGRHIERRII
jgi:hypothetical protein